MVVWYFEDGGMVLWRGWCGKNIKAITNKKETIIQTNNTKKIDVNENDEMFIYCTFSGNIIKNVIVGTEISLKKYIAKRRKEEYYKKNIFSKKIHRKKKKRRILQKEYFL